MLTMYDKLETMLRRRANMILTLTLLLVLLIAFYQALIHTTNKYKNDPIRIHRRSPIQRSLSRLEKLLEKSVLWASQSREQKLSTLLSNPVYRNLRIRKPQEDYVKKKVNLLLIVSSGPRRFDRRKGIRQTWWKDCKPTNGVVPACLFFTDLQQPGDKLYNNITKEQEMYGDMYFQPLRGGIEFGVRFLYHMVWSKIYYDFDYFLRIDDDYFFCLERFLYELPNNPPLTHFHWGYTHCVSDITRPEESIILFSHDVVETFLLQDPETIRCHPLADQMIGVWVTDLNINTLFRHDDRIHHAPIVAQVPQLRKQKNICQQYIGIHGTFGKDMKLFYKNKGIKIPNFKTTAERDKEIGNLLVNSAGCQLPHSFNYLLFDESWRHEPQRCIYDPKWDTRKHKMVDGIYSGREENKKLAQADVEQFGRRV